MTIVFIYKMGGTYRGLVLILLLTIFSVSATNIIVTPTIEAYCTHRGYTIKMNEDETGNVVSAFCVFNSTDECDLFEFYSNKCDLKYYIPLTCREEGDVVFTSFETCCEGLEVINENSVIDLPTCVSSRPDLWEMIKNLWEKWF